MSSIAYDPSTDKSPPFDTADDEAASIRTEMLLIEGSTDDPRARPRYTYLCRRLNSIQSIIHSVPPELLSIVFQYASPSPYYFAQNNEERRLFHLILRSVSSHWYNIVQSTPELWNFISLDLERRDKRFELYLKLCLDNSGCSPLTIHFGRSLTIIPELILSPALEKMIMCNAHHIQHLRLVCPPIQWLKSILAETSQLSALDARWCMRGYGPVDSTLRISSTNLRQLSIFGWWRELRLATPRMLITHLIFCHTPIDISLGLFLECQNLVEFQSISPQIPVQNIKPPVTQHPLVYKHLVKLAWYLPDNHNLTCWTQLLLRCIHVPSLKTLSWLNVVNFDQFLDAPSFFQRLPKSLKEITYTGMYLEIDVGTPIWLDYTRHDADIVSLQIEDCTESFLDKVFHKLFKKLTSSNELVTPFPQLKQLRSSMEMGNGKKQRMNSRIGEDLVRLLEERAGFVDQFTFWTKGYRLDWNKEVWLQLKRVQESSLNLVIGEDGECVDISAKCGTVLV